jgi:hypothetical protein
MAEVGRLGPASHPLVIRADEDAVVIGTPTGGWALDAECRDRFQRLFMEAERQAEAWIATAVIEECGGSDG